LIVDGKELKGLVSLRDLLLGALKNQEGAPRGIAV